MKRLIISACILLTFGCALNRPYIKEKTTSTATNGVVTVSDRMLKVTTLALWPADTEVTKQKASAGKTLSTGVDDVTAKGGGTNLVTALSELRQIMELMVKAAP